MAERHIYKEELENNDQLLENKEWLMTALMSVSVAIDWGLTEDTLENIINQKFEKQDYVIFLGIGAEAKGGKIASFLSDYQNREKNVK